MRVVVRGMLAVGMMSALMAGQAGAWQQRDRGTVPRSGDRALIAGPAGAGQQEPRGAGLALGGFHLLGLPVVQKELKLDDDQAKKANDLAARMNQRFQVDMGKLKGLKGDEQMKRLPTLAGPHYDEGMKAIRGFLKPDQVDRFDQILFQQRGPSAMLEPGIAKSLQLTNDQAQKVAGLVAEAQKLQKEAVQAAQGDPKAALPKLREVAKDTTDKAVALLTDAQKKTWERLTGPLFDPKPEAEPAK